MTSRDQVIRNYPGKIECVPPLWGDTHWEIRIIGKSSHDSFVLGSGTTEEAAWDNAAARGKTRLVRS